MIDIIFNESNEVKRALDTFLIVQPEFSPYQHSAWREAVKRAYGFNNGVIIAKEHGQLVGFLPFNQVNNPFGRSQMVSLPFCDIGGAVAVSQTVKEQLEHAFVQLSSKTARGCELRQNCAMSLNEELLADRKVRMQVGLISPSSDMLASYAPKLRSQIKKAEKNGLTVEISTTPRLIDAFYSVYSANMHRLGSPPHSLDWFKAVASSYAAAESLLLCVVKHQEQVVGAGFVLRVGNRAVIPWASTLAEFNHLAPNMLLYWSIQSWLADHQIQYFDFGRSTFGEGTYRFKKQWGAQPIALDWLQYGADCQPIVEHKAASQSKIRPLLESIWRSMPEPLMTRLGSKLRRYITL